MKFTVIYQENETKKQIVLSAENLDELRFSKDFPKNIIDIKIIKELNLKQHIRFNTNNKLQELYFIKELSMLLNAKLTLHDSLKILQQTSNDEQSKALTTYLLTHIENGNDFNKLFQTNNYFLSNLSVMFFKLSSKSGDITNNINSLNNILTLKYEQTKKIKEVLTYPIFLLFITLFVLIFLFSFVIPEFQNILSANSKNLPLLTKILFFISDNISIFSFIIIISIVCIVAFAFGYYHTNNFKYKTNIDFILLNKIPLVSNILYQTNMYIWFLVLYEQSKAKYKLQETLIFSEIVISNLYLKSKIEELITGLNYGKSLTSIIEKDNFFGTIALQLIRTAEETNNYEIVFKQLSDIHKTKLNDKIKIFILMFEPLFILILALFILGVTLGIFIPIWDFAKISNF